jgi:hypothetical protein
MKIKYLVIFLGSILSALLFIQCTSNVDSNPDPGVLRINIVTNPADTCIQIGFDSLFITNNDNFPLIISQIKTYTADENYAQLFPNFAGYKDEDIEYNFLEREQDSFVPQKIVESYIPPDAYNKIMFIIYPMESVTIQGLTFPIKTADDYDPLITLDCNYSIDQNQEYEIYIRFNAFQSITRWRDTYYFTPIFEIISN